MKFGIIGEPCIDYIHRGNTAKDKQLGGILYSIVSLAVIAGKENEVYPIMNLGDDEFEYVISFLLKFKNIKHDFINKSEHKTRIVNLYYKTSPDEPNHLAVSPEKTYDREESSTEPAFPVEYEFISGAAKNLDGLLINMVSGVDITLNTLKQIRENFKGYIHMDLHNVVMNTNADGSRLQGPVIDWEQWCSQCDTLQMNESEISAMHTEKMNEYETADKILADNKVKAVAITRGKSGVSLYQRVGKNSAGEKYFELDKIDLPAIERNDFKDSTGCGDVFASSFFYKNMVHNLSDFHGSLNYANKMASASSSLAGVEELDKLG